MRHTCGSCSPPRALERARRLATNPAICCTAGVASTLLRPWPMKRQHLAAQNMVTVLVLAGIVLMMGAALCAVGLHGHGSHVDHDEHGVALDLCLALYSAPSMITLLVALV